MKIISAFLNQHNPKHDDRKGCKSIPGPQSSFYDHFFDNLTDHLDNRIDRDLRSVDDKIVTAGISPIAACIFPIMVGAGLISLKDLLLRCLRIYI